MLCNGCYERLNFFTLPVEIKLEKIYFESAFAALQYDSRSKRLISELKYKSVIDAGRVLGELLYFSTTIPKTDMITAVPLHPKRQRLRGFNQAEIIARTVAEKMNAPYLPLLKRIVNTSQQAKQQSRKSRLSALSQAFELAVPKEIVSGKSILIIDDVITTGTTLNECSKILKDADCKAIFVTVIASR